MSLREFRVEEEVRMARMLAWALKCITGAYDVLRDPRS